jgi:hypothetical protein
MMSKHTAKCLFLLILSLMLFSLPACQSMQSPQNDNVPSQPQTQALPEPRSVPFTGNQTNLLSNVADILNISTGQLSSAYNQAVASVFQNQQLMRGERMQSSNQTPGNPAGMREFGARGQKQPGSTARPGLQDRLIPGSDNVTRPAMPDMSAVYEKMASILNISPDKISAAFEQAGKVK